MRSGRSVPPGLPTRRHAIAGITGFAAGLLTGASRAQGAAWPARQPRYVVPFATGGVTDNVGRLLALKLGERLGQTVVVENRPGVSGIVGTQSVARAAGDAYTMMGGTITTHAVNPFFVKQLGYDPVRDFTPVTLVGMVSNVLVVNAESRIDSVQALIDELRRRPDALTYGTSGAGTSQHLSGQLFQHLTGTRMRQVPYKGGTQALVDLVGGQIDMVFDTVSAARALLDGKRIKPLAVTSRQRLAALPGVPTLAEAGVAGFEMQSWQAVFMPAGVDAAVVDRLQQELAAVLRQPEVQARLREMGVEADGRGAAELAAFQRAEMAKWGRVIQAAGIQAE